MKSKEEREDKLLRSFFQRSEIRATIDITEQVMHQIDTSSKLFEYRPIIGKKVWIGLAGVFVLLMAFLLSQAEGISYQTPVLFDNLSTFFAKLGSSFDFNFSLPELPKIPSTVMIVIAAINIIGVYLIITYRWSRRMFK